MTKQPNRAGRPWQRKDGRWSTRAYPPDGSKPKLVIAATEEEVLDRQHEIEAVSTNVDTEAQAIIDGTTPAQQRIRAALARPKTTRITVDLDPDDYAALIRQAAGAAAESGRRVSLAEAVRTMIREAQ